VLAICALALVIPLSPGFADDGDHPVPAASLGIAFVHQGRLTIEGVPANTPLDFEFRLFADAAGTTLAPGTAATSATKVRSMRAMLPER